MSVDGFGTTQFSVSQAQLTSRYFESCLTNAWFENRMGFMKLVFHEQCVRPFMRVFQLATTPLTLAHSNSPFNFLDKCFVVIVVSLKPHSLTFVTNILILLFSCRALISTIIYCLLTLMEVHMGVVNGLVGKKTCVWKRQVWTIPHREDTNHRPTKRSKKEQTRLVCVHIYQIWSIIFVPCHDLMCFLACFVR